MTLEPSRSLHWTPGGELLLRPAGGREEYRIEALIFDLGGTLDADGEPWSERFARLLREERLAGPDTGCIVAALEAGERALLEHPRAAFLGLAEMVRVQVRAQLARLAASDAVDPARAEVLASRFVGKTADTLRRRRGLLVRLAARLPLALVSNGCGNTRRILMEHGLEASFRRVVDSSDVRFWKPDPRIFEPALEALGVTPERIAVVGDRLDRDVAGARAAGLRSIWVTRDPALGCGRDRRWEADATLSSVDQLEPVGSA